MLSTILINAVTLGLLVGSISPACSTIGVVAAPSAINLGPTAVNLGTAGNFAILSKSGISTVPQSAITGAIGVSPIASNAFTGFSLTLDASGTFATSRQVTGEVMAASFSAPTPSKLTTAVSDMQTAFTDATGRVNPGFINLASGAIGGLILKPGLYKWSGAVTISSAGVTISGTSADHFIFQIASTFSLSAGARITLSGGVLASNIVWVVSGAVTAGPGSHIEGVILGQTAVTLETGTTMNGRILAQTFVALQEATVVG
ncbi:ice-binding protein [Lentinula edodes]|nr:ice-binding protein [Lentinula edodes]